METPQGRPIKFTPERFDQIRNLVDRGMSRQEIADTIGVTLGSLQVTCSRVGLSLRRPRPSTGGVVKMNAPPVFTPKATNNSPPQVSLSLIFTYKGQQQTNALNLSTDTITRLGLEATMRDLKLSDLVAQILTEWCKQ